MVDRQVQLLASNNCIYRMRFTFLIGLWGLVACISCGGQGAGPYLYKKGHPDGISKWYMGRQIAHVMGHQGIGWLERPEREEEEYTSVLLVNMNLKPGEVVADIGAGSGYHTFQIAPLVGKDGRVYAVDIQPEMLAFIETKARELRMDNIKLQLGNEQKTSLGAGSVDKILLVDVYHELSYPFEMALDMLAALKPGGQLYLVEFRAEDSAVPIKQLHKMTEKQAVQELEAAGFRFVKNLNNLPWQHCLVFKKPG